MKWQHLLKNIGALIIVLFCFVEISAQNAKFEAATAFGSSAADEPYYALTDKDGNYYIVGMASGDIKFANGTVLSGRGGKDAILVKYDAELNLEWARYVGGSKDDTFESLAVMSNGDLVAVGQISGKVTIDGTSETIIATNATDGCIVVFDKDGNYKSSSLITGTGNSLCYSVVVDKNDNIFVTGSTLGETAFGNEKSITITGSTTGMFLACYNKELSCRWAISGIGEAASYGWALCLDKDENILLTGRFGTSIKIVGTDGQEVDKGIGAASGSDTFISKFTHEGVCKWITYITNGTNRIDARSIAADSKGNVVIFGHSNSAVTVEGVPAYSFAGNFDSFLVRFDSDGKYVDGFSIGGSGRDEGKSVFIDKDDNIYIAGNINGANAGTAVNMNPKGEAVNRTFKGHDGYFAKYNGSTLELMQVEKTTTPVDAAQHEVAWNVTMSPDFCKIYVTGYFNNGATIFDGEGGSLTLPFAGSYDIYTILYSSCFMVKTKTLPGGTVGEIYYAGIEVDNSVGNVSYNVTSGDLPGGITLNADGVLSGTPTKGGNYTFALTISDQESTVVKEYSILILSGEGCDVFIRTDKCDNAYLGKPYSQQLEIDGESYTCSLSGGALPQGLTLQEDGSITGTPVESNTEGIYTFKVKASKDEGCFDELELNMILSKPTGLDVSEWMNSFLLYPTVARTEIFVKADFNKFVNAKVQVITPLGVPVWEKSYQLTSIDDVISTTDLQPGIYYVLLITEYGKTTKPFIVK